MKIIEIHRLLTESKKKIDEDEMTSAVLSTTPQGGALQCGDNYASGDMRIPKILSKIQKRRKVQEDAENANSTIYRFMSLDELSSILVNKGFKKLLVFEEDAGKLRSNPAGDDFPYFKSFAYKISEDALRDFMGQGGDEIHIICELSLEYLKKAAKAAGCKFIKYKFEKGEYAVNEYEYRIFSEDGIIPVDPKKLIRRIIFTKESGNVNEEDIKKIVQDILFDLRDYNIDVPVEYIENVLDQNSKKISYKLNENDDVVEI